MDTQDFTALADALLGCDRLMLTTHVAPDGDGLGSALLLRQGLEKLGRTASIVVCGEVPASLDLLDPEGLIRVYPRQADAGFIASHDGVVVLDASEWTRIGPVAGAVPDSALRICIDHHVARADFARVSYSRVAATATAEIVHDLLVDHWGGSLDARMALPLYVALMTETGNFRYSNTTARCLRLAAGCIERGVDPYRVSSMLYERRSEAGLRLLGRALGKLRRDATGRLAWIALGLEDFAATGAGAADTVGMVSYPRSLEGVELAVLMFEDEPRFVKMSFRSKHHVDVSRLAARFGGGGHVRAAGAALRMGLEEAVARVLPEATSALAAAAES